MDVRDRFARPTATPALLATWLAEVARTLPALVGSYGGRGPLDPRTRERLILAVSEVNGCRYTAWVHDPWQTFLGDGDTERADVLVDYARACARARRPLPVAALARVLPSDAVRAVRATVAHVEVANLVGNTFDSLIARVRGRRRGSPLDLAREAMTVSLAAPLAAPFLATAGIMRLANRWAPPLPPIELPDDGEANLLAHLLATAVPVYLATSAARLAVLRLPAPLVIGVRAGRTAATVRIDRRVIVIDNGIAPDAVVVVEGDVERLFGVATGSIVRQARAAIGSGSPAD